MNPRLPSVVSIVSLALLLAGCAAAPKPRSQRVSVTVAPAEQRTMPFVLIATGTVEPIRTASVGAQVNGVVQRVAFREGAEVSAGQVLFQLDARPLRAAYDQARATLAKTRAEAGAARQDAERARKLLEQNLISEAEMEQKQAAADAQAAGLQADSAAAATAKLNLDYATIRAPISGRSGRLMVHEGDLVRAATATPLVTINQVKPVRVAFSVPVSAVPLVQRYRNGNPKVIVRTADDDSAAVTGTLAFVDNAVDQASGTLMLKGEFENKDGRLVAGQFVDVRLVLYEDAHATVVPAPAVTNGQQGTFVYVLNPDSTVATRPVSVSRTVDELSIVAQGLQPGEVVVTEGQLRLSPGAKVVVRERDAAPDSARAERPPRGRS